MAEKKPLKISYCTTCKGRLHHLKQTLPANMAAEKDNPNVEFVVLDYGSEDGLGAWIKQNYQDEMASGRLRYARYEATNFNYAHSRNMVHRIATGDILCNVDADNFIVPNFSAWLRQQFSDNKNSIVSCLVGTIGDILISKNPVHKKQMAFNKGIGGRIAISRENYYHLNGYNELYSGGAGEDLDFYRRARDAGIERVNLPPDQQGSVIDHDDKERTKFLDTPALTLSRARIEKSPMMERIDRYKRALSKPEAANSTGNVGCGTVHINFLSTPTEIKPLSPNSITPPNPQPDMAELVHPSRRTGLTNDVSALVNLSSGHGR